MNPTDPHQNPNRNPHENPDRNDGIESAAELEREAAELDALAQVPDEVLARQVAGRGRCLWEITDGGPPDVLDSPDPDREMAARLCAGCPVRRECLELELRTAGELTVGVWGALGEHDRRVLHTVWRARAIRTHHTDDDNAHEHDDQEGEQQT